MTLDVMIDLFERYTEDLNSYAQWESLQNKRSNRRDLHAFLLLDSLVPCEKGSDIISSAEHDMLFLSTDAERLAAVVTEEIVFELIRSGVMCNDRGALFMYA